MIRLLVIENHETIIVSGFRQLFRPQRHGIDVTQSAVCVSLALEKADPLEFDVIILDLWIPGEKPLDNVRRLKNKFPLKPILVYSTEDSREWIRKMFNAGVKGYVIKDASREELKNAIENVAAGQTWFTHLEYRGKPEAQNLNPLTEEESITMIQKKIARYLLEGKNIKEISYNLGATQNQVEKTLVRMRGQFDARTNVELVKILMDRELL
jgi:DNA-binding NarL/FixJ family response regulator